MSKWANCLFFWSKLLIRSFAHKNEWFAQKNLTKIIFFGTFFVSLKKTERFAHSLFFNEQCERIAQVAHQNWATIRDSLRLLTKNEWKSESLIFLSNLLIFSQKTSDSLRKPLSKIPTLCFSKYATKIARNFFWNNLNLTLYLFCP